MSNKSVDHIFTTFDRAATSIVFFSGILAFSNSSGLLHFGSHVLIFRLSYVHVLALIFSVIGNFGGDSRDTSEVSFGVWAFSGGHLEALGRSKGPSGDPRGRLGIPWGRRRDLRGDSSGSGGLLRGYGHV